MAPTRLYSKLSHYVGKSEKKMEPPMLSATAAALLSIFYTLFYVLPLYLNPTTRPSPSLSPDAPSCVRSRIRIVTLSVAVCTILNYYIISTHAFKTPLAVLHQLGFYPIGTYEICESILLTAMLFAGPLFEKGIVQGRWREWIKGRELHQSLSSWIGWRNYVAAPVTEEILFRSLVVSLHLLIVPQQSVMMLILTTPFYFGIAHVHHFYEFTLTHPYAGIGHAMLRSAVQFCYTTLFGWYATFLFLRTGSVWAVIFVHAFCNWMGLPRFWGRVQGVRIEGGVMGATVRAKEDQEKGPNENEQTGIVWTLAYYCLLFGGSMAWWKSFRSLTMSKNALVAVWNEPGVQ